MNNRIAKILFFGIFLLGCSHNSVKLLTKSVEIGDKKCTVQQMPEEFHEEIKNGHFDYFRIIIESDVKLNDNTDVSYVNFGIENSIKKIVASDTLYPSFLQRIANGKKENYEYIVSFEKEPDERKFDLYIDDHLFGMGGVTFTF